MGAVTVKVYTTLRDKLGTGNVSLDADNVKEALISLEDRFGSRFRDQLYENGKIKNYYILLLNGHTVDTKKMKQAKLKTGDILHIFPPIAGG